MIALDTNVLVRLIVADDVQQAERARKLLDDCIEEDEPCFVSLPVLCELEWVLDSVYRAARREIAAAVEQLLVRPPFLVEEKHAVKRALAAYLSGKGDLSDYIIAARGELEGARTTFTFDRELRSSEGFTRL